MAAKLIVHFDISSGLISNTFQLAFMTIGCSTVRLRHPTENERPVAMTPPTSLGSDGSYIWRNMVQTDGGIPYSVARSQRGSLQLKVSEAIVFEVTLHFSVSVHRDCIDPLLHVAFMSGLIQGVCGTSLTVNGVWRGTHGDLWYPLREDARFGARVYHSTCNLPPPPTFPCTRIVLHVPLTGTPTYAQKSWGLHTRCDPAPLTTSFGTVGQWERQHLAMTATCPEGEAWAASRNWNHGTHFLWDPTAAPTFHPLTTQRHRVQRSTFHFQLSTVVQ